IEDQDQWWLSGIFRDVTLIGYSQMGHIEDFEMQTVSLNNDTATVQLHAKIEHASHVGVDLVWWVGSQRAVRASGGDELCKEQSFNGIVTMNIEIKNPALWSAESPHLYNVELQLWNNGTLLHRITTHFGIRTVEIQGEVLLVNGQRIMFKGVNRHDNNPWR